MRLRLFAAAAVSLGLGGVAATADPATPDGAKAIAAAYAAYFGPAVIAKGVVTVTPDGDDYVVSWDLGKAIAAFGAPVNVAEVAPFVYRITPTLEGGWFARASSLPKLSVRPAGEAGREGGTAAFDGFRFDGLFDAAASEFWRSKMSLGALKLDLTAKSGADMQHVTLAEDGIAGELRIKAGDEADSVDIHMTQSIVSAGQTTAVIGEGAAETPASETRQGAGGGDSRVEDLRAKAFGDLWRFLVARAGGGPPLAAEELKPKLVALLPLWKELAGQFHLDDVAIAFPGGSIGAKSASEEVRITGLVEQSSAALALTVKDLTVDIEAAPDWVKTLWPASFEFQVEAGVGALDRAARLALDDGEFFKSGKLSDDAKAQILQTLLAGRPQIAIHETRLATPIGDATLEGAAAFGEEGPEAHAKVTASDLDKLMETLAKISETQPNARQLLYLATFARGLAKSEDGRLVWEIEYVAPNELRVNGQVLSTN